jgi:hypothetical protein
LAIERECHDYLELTEYAGQWAIGRFCLMWLCASDKLLDKFWVAAIDARLWL